MHRDGVCNPIDRKHRKHRPKVVAQHQCRVAFTTSHAQRAHDAAIRRLHHSALTWLAEALTDLGAHAARHGVPLLYEPLNRYETNLLNRQLDAAQFLESRKVANVKLLCDLFHMNIEEVSNAATLRACGRHVGHVHFADSNRQAIGFGHTDAASAIAALKDIGFAGYLSGEILPLPDSEAAAAQTIKAIRTHLPR